MPPRQGVEYAKPVVRYRILGETIDRFRDSRAVVECPFCKAQIEVHTRSLNENGRKKCTCGASFFPDGTAESRR